MMPLQLKQIQFFESLLEDQAFLEASTLLRVSSTILGVGRTNTMYARRAHYSNMQLYNSVVHKNVHTYNNSSLLYFTLALIIYQMQFTYHQLHQSQIIHMSHSSIKYHTRLSHLCTQDKIFTYTSHLHNLLLSWSSCFQNLGIL